VVREYSNENILWTSAYLGQGRLAGLRSHESVGHNGATQGNSHESVLERACCNGCAERKRCRRPQTGMPQKAWSISSSEARSGSGMSESLSPRRFALAAEHWRAFSIAIPARHTPSTAVGASSLALER
jgi:hypothetical protein